MVSFLKVISWDKLFTLTAPLLRVVREVNKQTKKGSETSWFYCYHCFHWNIRLILSDYGVQSDTTTKLSWQQLVKKVKTGRLINNESFDDKIKECNEIRMQEASRTRFSSQLFIHLFINALSSFQLLFYQWFSLKPSQSVEWWMTEHVNLVMCLWLITFGIYCLYWHDANVIICHFPPHKTLAKQIKATLANHLLLCYYHQLSISGIA